ncbi:DUF2189 domain-containing protein [Permianibacter sp. IMCC34836]|uniref:DUF2189 domain-containing protein n=1 Tax=Permianibacter fluminis TaxID=2738515 RepID=UPI0015548C8E|nr:DUF2189 domain-containing protein [Permianibacter fluminis]NQD37586.1 DUF2189 domain-containing protein [Permianibacter fluminis]
MTEPQLSPSHHPETPSTDPFAGPKLPAVRTVTLSAPLLWLRKGLNDMRLHPIASGLYGMAFALMGWILQSVLLNALQYFTTLLFGFFLLGPFLATGLYNVAKQTEAGKPATAWRTMMAWQANVQGIGIYLLITTVILLIWGRASLITFAMFFSSGLPELKDFLAQIVSLEHLDFVITYLVVGGIFATIVFAISVVSVPMMLDRDAETFASCFTSLRVLAANPLPMLFWAVLIVLLIGAGFATGFFGLILTGPWVGLATWHAYRGTVGE